MLYNKTFWAEYNSHRLNVIEDEFLQIKLTALFPDVSAPYTQIELLEKYIEATESDISIYFEWYKIFSQFQDINIQSVLPFNYSYTDSPQFEANIEISDDLQSCDINLSFGLVFSIHDLMHRICCNKGILSENFEPPEIVWEGTICFFPESHLYPKIRFSDYDPVDNTEFGVYTGNTLSTLIGVFHSGLAIEDKERLYTASLMEAISLTWVLFHEEAHYWHGHLHFISEGNSNVISETANQLIKGEPGLFKTFEWQADRNAIVDLINMLFVGQDDKPFELPNYIKSKYEMGWYLRIIIVSIGSTILMFQKRMLINKTSSYYPSPQTRLSTVLGIIYGEIMLIFEKQGHVLNISDFDTLRFAITDGFITGLNDLLGVEAIMENNVDYENNIQRVIYEKVNPKSMMFLENFNNISEIIKGLFNNLTSDDPIIENTWFSEYKQLVINHDYLYANVLPNYRRIATKGNPACD